MNKKTIKILSAILIALAVVIMVGSTVFALDTTYLDPGQLTGKGDQGVIDTTQGITATIISVIQIVGTTFAVAMLIFVAIKYLTSAAEGKAEIKKYAVAYIVGAFLLFGVTGILGVIKNWSEKATNGHT